MSSDGVARERLRSIIADRSLLKDGEFTSNLSFFTSEVILFTNHQWQQHFHAIFGALWNNQISYGDGF